MSKELISLKRMSGLFTLQYSIQEENHTFPINQTIILLKEMGFAISNKTTLQKSTIELRSNDNVAYLTKKELNFLNNLPSGKAEYLKSKLHELLVTRIKILNQAAKQNSNAAIINLLQDQRRASVSDTYYSLFNSLGSLIEHTKEIHLKEIFQQQTTMQELNFEDNRKHGTPDEAKKIINRTAKIIETLKNKSFTVDNRIMNFANESLSRTNSFLWLLISTYFINEEVQISETINTYVEEDLEGNTIDKKKEIINSPMEEKKILKEKWQKIINGLKEFIYIIDIESFAIGVSGREKFEKDFVEVYKDYKNSIGNENDPETVYGILGCFYLYTYALRQMADYDGSFDSRIDVKVNSLLCYYIELFNEFVISFTENIEYKEDNKRIKRITSVRPTQLSPQHEEKSSKLLFHISGILVITELDLINLYKKLLQHDAYKPIAINDRMVIPSGSDNSLIIDRVLPRSNIKFRISLSENVLWIDVIGGNSYSIYDEDDEKILKEHVNNTNVSALENIIVNQVIKQEILPLVSNSKLLYLGNLACYHKFEECFVHNINNLELSSPTIQWHLDIQLKEKLEVIKNNEVEREISIPRGFTFNYNNSSKESIHKNITRMLRMRMRRYSKDSILVIPLYFFYEASKKEIEEIQSLMLEYINNLDLGFTAIILPISKDILDELFGGDDLYFDCKSDELTDSHIKIIRKQLNINQESIVPSTKETEGELEAVKSGPAVQGTDNELKTVNPVLK
ncbi:hypothetical protein [Priestia aryabhattai]|uniref:hypothetical protein n=1 Tax=Priestia aryabhattai TaxID=412384 RepID=UPI001C8E029D|nr:hypothetical protein [Priestia aryabhattai]MBY0214609.1 hypothetical protein [Priestia aryabhattai]